MTSSNVIENKVSSVKKYLAICAEYKKYSLHEIETNRDIRGMVERYLYLAAQATIDLAESYIALKNLRKPTTMSEAFYILEEEGFISQELAQKMIAMVGFRNIMSHDYDKINYAIVYDVLLNRLEDIKVFLNKFE